jgi:hypothetical protein
MKRFLAVLAVLAVILLVARFRKAPESPVAPAVLESGAVSGKEALPSETDSPPSVMPREPERSELVEQLNSPDGDIATDLRVLLEVFAAWQTNFPRQGNPVGENDEITRALMGDNVLLLALVPRDHPAVGPKGQLLDRWGTPFRFHQLSGTHMEIRSAGPDRRFSTEDDAVASP